MVFLSFPYLLFGLTPGMLFMDSTTPEENQMRLPLQAVQSNRKPFLFSCYQTHLGAASRTLHGTKKVARVRVGIGSSRTEMIVYLYVEQTSVEYWDVLKMFRRSS